jgi:hypothetical protein
MRKIEINDRTGYRTVETIQIGARASTNRGGSWRQFEPALDTAEITARMGSWRYMYYDQGPPDPLPASLAFECLGKVSFKGRVNPGYREPFNAVVSIVSVMSPLSEKEKRKNRNCCPSLSTCRKRDARSSSTGQACSRGGIPSLRRTNSTTQGAANTVLIAGYIWIEPPTR